MDNRIDKRQNFKDINIGNRTFRIEKFDAYTGSYIAYQVMAEALPMGLSGKLGIPQTEQSKKMSKEDFKQLQMDCLSVCYELLAAGQTPILDSTGNFTVVDLEHNVQIVLALTLQALTFNISSFFDESLLGSLAEAFSDIVPQNAKTSMSSSTHR